MLSGKLVVFLEQVLSIIKNPSETEVSEKHISVEAANLWYQALMSRYEAISHANDAIDTKLTVLATISLALVTLILTGAKLEINVLTSIGIVLLGGCALISTLSSRVSSIAAPVNSHDERPDYYNKTDEEFVWQLIPDIEEATRKTLKINETKSRYYNISLGLLALGVILLVLSQYVTISVK
ncbi:hypothetical protein EYC59_04330 [Candidatus Saccharibacteria bacterium]|nr:MAG: hypothetical protein EYC59_04330 [Candidatus Saccharibacteria bacterium]